MQWISQVIQYIQTEITVNRSRFITALCLLIFFPITNQQALAQTLFNYSAREISYGHVSIARTDEITGMTYVADLNGDGATDIIIPGANFPDPESGPGNPQPGLILFNNGDNTFSVAEGDVPFSEHARDFFVEDFNGDGIADIYIADHGWDADPFPGFKNQFLLGTGTGFIDETNRLPDVAGFTHNAGVADIDGDGDLDIFVQNLITFGSSEDEVAYFLLNDGSANFTLDRERLPVSLKTFPRFSDSNGTALADLDNDGRAELLIGRVDGNQSSRIYWNNGLGFFSDDDVTNLEDADVFGGLNRIQVVQIQGVDVDGNGQTDILTHAYADDFTGVSTQLFMNKGNRIFKDEALLRLGSGARDPGTDRKVPFFSKFVDINNDDILDIVMLGELDTTDAAPVIFEGRGDGCFNTVTMADISNDSQKRFLLGHWPIYSPTEFGYLYMSSLVDNGVTSFSGNYVPLEISPLPTIANQYNSCRGKLEVIVDIGDGVLFALDFSIVSTEPIVVIQADAASAENLDNGIDKMATFSDGILIIPELVIDGEVQYRNLEFELTDSDQLLFRLNSLE